MKVAAKPFVLSWDWFETDAESWNADVLIWHRSLVVLRCRVCPMSMLFYEYCIWDNPLPGLLLRNRWRGRKGWRIWSWAEVHDLIVFKVFRIGDDHIVHSCTFCSYAHIPQSISHQTIARQAWKHIYDFEVAYEGQMNLKPKLWTILLAATMFHASKPTFHFNDWNPTARTT